MVNFISLYVKLKEKSQSCVFLFKYAFNHFLRYILSDNPNRLLQNLKLLHIWFFLMIFLNFITKNKSLTSSHIYSPTFHFGMFQNYYPCVNFTDQKNIEMINISFY